MSRELDLRELQRSPKIDVPGAIALGQKLLTAAPPNPPPAVAAALAALRTAHTDLQRLWTERTPEAQTSANKTMDNQADIAWRAFYERLVAGTHLPVDLYPESAQASQLVATLFPDGLTFIAGDYDSQWAETEKRLDLIDKNQLVPLVHSLVGPSFLAEVRRTHDIYGKTLGITQVRDKAPPAPSLLTPLRATTRAMSDYFLQLAALYRSGTAEDREMVTRASDPLIEYRIAAQRRAAAQERSQNQGDSTSTPPGTTPPTKPPTTTTKPPPSTTTTGTTGATPPPAAPPPAGTTTPPTPPTSAAATSPASSTPASASAAPSPGSASDNAKK